MPYLTTPSDLKNSYHEHTRVFMFRMMVLTVGVLSAGVAAPALVKSGERGDYAQMALLLSVVMLVTGVIGILGVCGLTEHTGVTQPAARDQSFAEDVKVVLRDRDIRALVLPLARDGKHAHLGSVVRLLVPTLVCTPLIAWALADINTCWLALVAGCGVIVAVGILVAGVRWHSLKHPLGAVSTGIASALLDVVGGVGGRLPSASMLRTLAGHP